MSQENVEVIRAMYEALDQGEAALMTYLHPDAELHQPPELPDADSYYGRDEFIRGIGIWLSEWEDFRFRPEEITPVGDCVLMRVALWGRGKGSGVESTLHVFHSWTVRDGKAHQCFVRTTRAEALEAVGLSE